MNSKLQSFFFLKAPNYIYFKIIKINYEGLKALLIFITRYQCLAPCIYMSTIKKIIITGFKLYFFQKMFKLYIYIYIVLAYTFFKPYISKICNNLYIYIYIYMIQNLLGFRLFENGKLSIWFLSFTLYFNLVPNLLIVLI